MNKEVVVAIIIGVLLGLAGALYFSNLKPSGGKQIFSFNDVNITPRTTSKLGRLAEFEQLPENGSLLTQNTITFKGRADKDSRLFIANQLTIDPVKISHNQFSQEMRLKPGRNEIVLYELNGEKEQLKVIKLYFLDTNQSGQTAQTEQPTATEEADLLKQKLEKKVLELRNNPKRVVSGQIKTINDKVVNIDNGTDALKIIVEPEITNFYTVNDYNLIGIEFNDLKQGNLITAFVSDIGGDEISYTVYQEPEFALSAGKVSNIDSDNYQITIIDFDKSSFGADIQVGTIQNVFDLKSGKVSEAGFSKLAIGQRIFAILSGSKGKYSVDEYLILQ